MRISLAKVRAAIDPNLMDFVIAVARNNARSLLANAALTDSSTGTAGSVLVPVLTQEVKVVPSGANLASRADFNTAMTSFNNAMAVLSAFFNTNVFARTDLPQLSGATGTVATPGTIPALTKSVTGVDGSAGGAMLRVEMNAALTRARNNLSHMVKAYNIAATAVGVPTLPDNTVGKASYTMTVYPPVSAGTAVAAGSVGSSDLASKVGTDAGLLALANNVAYLADRVNNALLANATLSARIPAILMP